MTDFDRFFCSSIDYDKLAEILLQRPIDMEGPTKTRLTDAEIAQMQEMAKKRFDTVLDTLKLMPRSMLFIVRYVSADRFFLFFNSFSIIFFYIFFCLNAETWIPFEPLHDIMEIRWTDRLIWHDMPKDVSIIMDDPDIFSRSSGL